MPRPSVTSPVLAGRRPRLTRWLDLFRNLPCPGDGSGSRRRRRAVGADGGQRDSSREVGARPPRGRRSATQAAREEERSKNRAWLVMRAVPAPRDCSRGRTAVDKWDARRGRTAQEKPAAVVPRSLDEELAAVLPPASSRVSGRPCATSDHGVRALGLDDRERGVRHREHGVPHREPWVPPEGGISDLSPIGGAAPGHTGCRHRRAPAPSSGREDPSPGASRRAPPLPPEDLSSTP